jgi:hypothetical protein
MSGVYIEKELGANCHRCNHDSMNDICVHKVISNGGRFLVGKTKQENDSSPLSVLHFPRLCMYTSLQ